MAPRSVLLIDDSFDFCVLLDRVLRQANRGLNIRFFHESESAISYLLNCAERATLPDMVLLDCVMPGGPGGFEILRAMRMVESMWSVRVLMLSGSSDPRHMEEAKEAGADGYIIKPPERGPAYQVLARQVLGWRNEDSWRWRGGASAGLELAAPALPLQSEASQAMVPAPVQPVPVVAVTAAAAEPNVFMQMFRSLHDLVLETFDPIDLAIKKACRKHHIPPAHARRKGGDYITVQNRHRVILDLMDEGFGNGAILENFDVSQRTLERLREEWQGRNGGGTLADRPI